MLQTKIKIGLKHTWHFIKQNILNKIPLDTCIAYITTSIPIAPPNSTYSDAISSSLPGIEDAPPHTL